VGTLGGSLVFEQLRQLRDVANQTNTTIAVSQQASKAFDVTANRLL
jgi:hypothetical protein